MLSDDWDYQDDQRFWLFLMIFTVFSENWLNFHRPSQHPCLFLTTCKLSWFSPDQEKSHFFYNHVYNYLYYSFSLIMSVHDNTVIDTFWLCAAYRYPIIRTFKTKIPKTTVSKSSLQGFHMIVPIVPVTSNNVQTIGTTIWKRYPDDHKWPVWLRRPLSITWIELSSDPDTELGGSCKFWSDHMEMLSEDWDYQDDQRLSQKSSLSFH